MRTVGRMTLVVLLSATCLTAVCGVASARRFFIGAPFFIIWPEAERLRFSIAEFAPVECRVLMEGGFHSRTISKVCGQLVGEIRIAQRPAETFCVSTERFGEVWILNGAEEQGEGLLPNTLPWHVRYDSFTGTLPHIASIRLQIIGASFIGRGPFGIRCLYRSTTARPLYVIFLVNAASEIETLRVDETQPIPRKGEEFACPATATLSRRALVSTFAGNFVPISLIA